MIRRTPRSTRTDTLVPYTSLFRSAGGRTELAGVLRPTVCEGLLPRDPDGSRLRHGAMDSVCAFHPAAESAAAGGYDYVDRKSTRLNSVTNAQLVCRLLLEKKKKTINKENDKVPKDN